jgi:hypothetical protein
MVSFADASWALRGQGAGSSPSIVHNRPGSRIAKKKPDMHFSPHLITRGFTPDWRSLSTLEATGETSGFEPMIFARAMLIVCLEKIEYRGGSMITLKLTEDEAKVLQNIIENYHSHLEVEIHRTYRREFREALKEREKFLLDIAERIRKRRAVAA